MTAAELARVMPDVARHFWGEPNHHHSNGEGIALGHQRRAQRRYRARAPGSTTRPTKAAASSTSSSARASHDPWQWLRENGFAEHRDNGAGAKPKIVATYDYTDEYGALLFQVVRLDPKTFRQRRPGRRPDKVSGWIWNLDGVARVPYRLPELLEALALEQRVFIVEGEKDVRDARRATASRRPAIRAAPANGAPSLPSTWSAPMSSSCRTTTRQAASMPAPWRARSPARPRASASLTCPASPRRATCPTGLPPAARSRRSTTWSRRRRT